MKATIRVQNCEITFDDSDVVNPDDFTPAGSNGQRSYNPHNVRPWVLHDHGFVLAVVFASNLQDALDIAADEGKLDRYLIEETSNTPGTKGLPAEDYPTLGTENEEGITRLGNTSEPFDIETLGYIELGNPQFSFAALWTASQARVRSAHFA